MRTVAGSSRDHSECRATALLPAGGSAPFLPQVTG